MESPYQMEQTQWKLHSDPFRYWRYAFLSEDKMIAVDLVSGMRDYPLSVHVSLLDYEKSTDNWVRRHNTFSIGVEQRAPAHGFSWIAARRITSDLEEQVLVCYSTKDTGAVFVLIQGQNVVRRRTIDVDPFKLRSFATSVPDKAWVVCSRWGKVVVFDENLEMVAENDSIRGMVQHFFLDQEGTPTMLSCTTGHVFQMIKYRFSNSGRELVPEARIVDYIFENSSPSLPELGLVKRIISNQFLLVRWVGFDIQILREYSRCGSQCISEKWTYCPEEICSVQIANQTRFPATQLNQARFSLPLLKTEIVFWASKSDPDTFWTLCDKNIFRLKIRRQPRDSLAKLATVRAAEFALENIPDESLRKWFAATIANKQPTNHTIFSSKSVGE